MSVLLLLLIQFPADSFDRWVMDAALKAHAGWSVDEMLMRDDLRADFLKRMRDKAPDVSADTCFETLLRLRKSSRLRLPINPDQKPSPLSEDALHAGEIAARAMQDRHRVSFDQVLVRTNLLEEFDREAQRISPGIKPYDARRAALRLRKTRKLQPELVLRVADWHRDVRTLSLDEARRDPDRIPAVPGVYLFRDVSGYLYIGEAEDLNRRLRQHLTESDRVGLADYLRGTSQSPITIEIHAFPKDSPAAELRVRRAYESELIESRKPRFNVRP